MQTTDNIFPLSAHYASLPDRFYATLNPTPVQAPTLIRLNEPLASDLGLDIDALYSDEATAIFAGNRVPDGATPIAQAYAGHQFGGFVPQLGDGRALLLGELETPGGELVDIQLKGSGPTPFSRQGDGRAALGPVVREYILSEAMHALGVPTTRALAFVTTGEPVFREERLPGAILTRVASSHIRVGTFEYFAAREDVEALRLLADFAIERHYPELLISANPYKRLLETVADQQAQLVSAWMMVGFIHGVMNTDNTTISGETIDYGPCAFMDRYDPATVFSSIDHIGRYAYGNQGPMMQWNIACLGECLRPLLSDDEDNAKAIAAEVVDGFQPRFMRYWVDGMGRKIGLTDISQDDLPLIQSLLEAMQKAEADYTQSFRDLANYIQKDDGAPAWLADWLPAWRERLKQEQTDARFIEEQMNRTNPVYIPRNHLVEEAIEAAVEQNDFTPMDKLMQVLHSPFIDKTGAERYAQPAAASERVYQTFCGT